MRDNVLNVALPMTLSLERPITTPFSSFCIAVGLHIFVTAEVRNLKFGT